MAASVHELWERYRSYVKDNPHTVSQLEGATRILSYIIPAKLSSSEVLSELLYSASSLLVLLNDTILRNATRAYTSTPSTLPRLRSWLAVVECLEVFLETGAEKAGGPTFHWIVVICIQVFKTAVRFLILKCCPHGLQTTPAILSLNRKKDLNEQVDNPMDIADHMSGSAMSQPVDVTSPKDGPSMTFTLQRSGRTVRTIRAAPPMVQRTWKPPSEDDSLAMPTQVPTELNPKQHLAESLYLSRPLLHLLSMALFGRDSWKPWLVASGLDVSSLYLMGDHKDYNDQERAELTRRTTMLLFYMLRSPFYDTFTKRRLTRLLKTVAETVPGARFLMHPLMAYLPVWQKIYFYVWNQ